MTDVSTGNEGRCKEEMTDFSTENEGRWYGK